MSANEHWRKKKKNTCLITYQNDVNKKNSDIFLNPPLYLCQDPNLDLGNWVV